MPRTPGWKHLELEPCRTVTLPFELSAASEARRLVREALTAWEHSSERLETDAELVVGELVANSLEHGRPTPEGTVEVSWCLHEDHLLISVCDYGQAVPLGPVEADSEALSGRGLTIVDVLCDSWRVDDDRGTRVTAEMAVPA